MFQTVIIRRYRCQNCRTVIRVGPRGILRRHWYGAGAIALALALFGFSDLSQAEIRVVVSPWRMVAVETRRRWRSLARWAGSVETGRLWSRPLPLPRGPVAQQVARAFIRSLLALSPTVRPGPIRESNAFLVAHSGGWVV